jgi:hypothetical protein
MRRPITSRAVRTGDEDGKQDELARALVADRERLDCASGEQRNAHHQGGGVG